MPTNKQERERARRNLQQQLERRREAEARRRKTMIGVTVVATLAVIGVALGLVIGLSGDGKKPAAAAPPSAGATAPAGPCGYTAAPSASNPNVVDVGLPPDPDPTPTTNRTVAFTTNQGAITMELDAAKAPCNVQSVAFLAQSGFYNGTTCHRLVTTGIFVLQCGDPSGTGSGGPAYKVKDENIASADYSEGVVAMANSGADTNSSQFFIMTKDSNGGLGKNYTVIGKITAGMDVVSKVAAAGTVDGSTDGKPKTALTFQKVTVTPPLDIPSRSAPASKPAASGASGSPAQ